jgi:hypothetical protein
MKKTLQDQYLLIKEGKGHKGVFLADAKRDFPQYVPNAATFNEAVASLKTKNVISENIIGLSVVAGYEPKKKESYETAFEAFLAEAKKKENEDEKVKAEEKKVSKPVEKDLEKQYDNEDDKNPDNLIFGQIMTGYYAEMKDPKNADKTMQQLKDIVLKNLSKDPIHYTKDGQFGVKGLGYTTEAPGLGEPKEAKGKWKSSGYGDLKESKISPKIYPNGTKINYKGEPVTIIGNFMNRNDEFIQYKIEHENGKTSELSSADKNITKITNEDKAIDSFISNARKAFTEKDPNNKGFSKKQIEDKLNQLYPGRAERKKDNSPEESKLREIIREMIDTELGEATQMSTIINPKKIDKELKDEPTENAKYISIPDGIMKTLIERGYIIVDENGVFVSGRFVANLDKLLKYDTASNEKIFFSNPMVYSLEPSTKTNIYTGTQEPYKQITPSKGSGIRIVSGKIPEFRTNDEGDVKVIPPVDSKTLFQAIISPESWKAFTNKSKKLEESLMEGVEKELAAINKEAEHEILQSKLEKIQGLIDKKQSQISKLDEDEDMKALTDVKKVKEIEKDIKALEKAKSKIDKMMGKHKGKKKEVIDEMGDDKYEMSPEDQSNLDSWEQDSDSGQGREVDTEEEY